MSKVWTPEKERKMKREKEIDNNLLIDYFSLEIPARKVRRNAIPKCDDCRWSEMIDKGAFLWCNYFDRDVTIPRYRCKVYSRNRYYRD